jgi:hypothetical protein
LAEQDRIEAFTNQKLMMDQQRKDIEEERFKNKLSNRQ